MPLAAQSISQIGAARLDRLIPQADTMGHEDLATGCS
jgi:hypothetical protein